MSSGDDLGIYESELQIDEGPSKEEMEPEIEPEPTTRRSNRRRTTTRKADRKRKRGDDEDEEDDIEETKKTASRRSKRKPAKKANSSEDEIETEQYPKSSEEIIADWKINPVEINYTADEYKSLTTFRIFASAMRPRIASANPSLRSARMTTLTEAMWREFNAMNPHNIPQHEEHEIPIEKPKSKKRTAPKKEKKVAPLRIKLPKKTKKKASSDEDDDEFGDDPEFGEDSIKSKSTRVSSRANKGNREEDQDFETSTGRKSLKEPDEAEFFGKDYIEPERDEGPIQHHESCEFCKDGGDLLLCEYCPRAYHLKCLNPPQREIPDDAWACPFCSSEPLPGKIQRILSWRWHEAPYTEVDDDRPGKEGQKRKLWGYKYREFLCKFVGFSYWDVEWCDEVRMEQHSVHIWRIFCRKNNMELEPETEDVDSFDDTKLAETFYKYHINPDWLQIRRIINHRSGARAKKKEYLILWRNLPYSEISWMEEDRDIPGFKEEIQKYWDHRSAITEQKSKRDKRKLEKLTKKVKPYEDQPGYIKKLGLTLHAYQMEGLNWLRYSWSQLTNVILADEMGLGKTIQSVVFIRSLIIENNSRGPFLISVPLSTLPNWEREFDLWAPDLYVVSYHGDKDSRALIRDNEFSFDDKIMHSSAKVCKIRAGTQVKFHVLLTSYEMVSMDSTVLSSVDYGGLIIDEAHRLKNNQSLFFKTLSGYSFEHTVLLTGTPLQNNLEELFHLLNFLCPTKFVDLQGFLEEFAVISKEDQVKKLHDMLGKHMLRRLKADVLSGMKGKVELIVRTGLTPMQKKFSKLVLTKNYEALKVKGGTNTSLNNVLMELKKICNHPYLNEKAALEAKRLPNNAFEGAELVQNCGKLLLMSKMLKRLKEQGHRVLIFSQMTRLLDLLEDYLEYAQYRYERIDGSITGSLRQASIDRFNKPNSESFIFLLSTRAGGLGINLATADTVIIYDSDWNPHNDIQAFSRAHRIGQKNKVLIYRFVTQNSVEERVAQVAKRKMMLNHLVIRPGIGSGKGSQTLSKNEMDDILRFGTQDLFKNEEADSTKDVDYTDEMVEALLVRENKEDEGEKEEESNKLLDDYFSGFKVAKYQLTEDEKKAEQEEAEKWADQIESNVDQDYWDKLLRHHYEQHVEEESGKMGKGKRVRRQVQYFQPGQEEVTAFDDDQEYQGDDGPHAGSDNEYQDTGEMDGKARKRYDRNAPKAMPPKFAKTAKDFEVFGFHSRQRRAYVNLCMRYGLPPKDGFQDRWIVRELSRKSDKEFKAYSHTFMTHLCEPSSDGSDKFMDGVPKENLPRQGVLNRIGVMLLIQKKVEEFKKVNGRWSIKELNPENQPKEESNPDESEDAPEENKEAKTPDKKEAGGEDETNEEMETEDKGDEEITKETDDKEEENKMVEDTSKDEPVKTERNEEREKVTEDPPLKKKKDFMFNIADGGFTELHTLWATEEDAALNRHKKINEIWHRRHDYWLLAGMATHGYARWTDIQNDPKFAIINEPFRAMAAKQGNFQDMQNRFLGRRFKLLEQALVIEEQLRRSSYLNLHQDPNHQAMALTNRFAQLETISESHRELPKIAASGNKAAAHVLLKVLDQVEALLTEMKNDVVRLPTVLARVQPVSNRLGMTERTLLERLRAQNDDKSGYPPFNQMPPDSQSNTYYAFARLKSTKALEFRYR